MLISLQELELHRIVVSKTYAPGALDYRGAEFRQVSPLTVNAVAELGGADIRIQGRLETLHGLAEALLEREVLDGREIDTIVKGAGSPAPAAAA